MQTYNHSQWQRVVALAGGVGGAKLAYGLDRVLPGGALTVIVNTADDFERFGLHISPDLDTVMYNLAGLNHPEQGWGLAGETFHALEMLERYGQETWFRLGDRDLATHILRTQWLRQGITLSQVTERFCRALGIRSRILPMSDAPVRTIIQTPHGELAFQEYFVRERCEPTMLGMRLDGLEKAHAHPEMLQALEEAQLIIVCPSNPYVSVDPILSLPGVRERLRQGRAPVLAVSPIVGGQALKGPAGKMMAELGHTVSPISVAEHYRDFLRGFVLDQADVSQQAALAEYGFELLLTDTVMQSAADKRRLAEEILQFAAQQLAAKMKK